MKTFTFLLIVTLFFTDLSVSGSNAPVTFLEDGSTWCYYRRNLWGHWYDYYRYTLDGDTLINNQTYKKVYRSQTDTYDPAKATYVASIRKEGAKVYCPDSPYNLSGYPQENGETVLYDFSLSFGSTFVYDYMRVYLSTDIVLWDQSKKQLGFGSSKSSYPTWIEDLGILENDFFNPAAEYMGETETCLDMFLYKGEIVYGKPDFSFVRDGNHWVERITDASDEGVYHLDQYLIKGDTVISGKSYKKLYKNSNYKGGLRENLEHKVYYQAENEPEILLYDFHWGVRKTLGFTDYDGHAFSVTLPSSSDNKLPEIKLKDGKFYPYCRVLENPNPAVSPFKSVNSQLKLIRGIGFTSGIFRHLEDSAPADAFVDLLSFYNEKNELVYHNSDFDEKGEKIPSLLKDGATWCYYLRNVYNEYNYYRYVIDGDTLINNHTYKKMYRSESETYDRHNSKYVSSIRKEDRKILSPDPLYDFIPKEEDEFILYDFNLQAGDTFTSKSVYSSVDTLIAGQVKKCISFVDSGWLDPIWIEDIGILGDNFFNPTVAAVGPNNVSLDMFLYDGKVVYGASALSFVSEGNHWTERVTANPDDLDTYVLNHYVITGDTLISNRSYKKLYMNGNYKGALRENIEHKVYYYEEGKPEILLYDFHWGISKTLHLTDFAGTEFKIPIYIEYGQIAEMELSDGKNHQYCDIEDNPNPDGAPFKTLNDNVKLIRNIGLTAGIFKMPEVGKEDPSCYTDLVSFYGSDGHLIYQNPYFNEEGVLTSIDHSSAKAYLCVSGQGNQVTFSLPLPVNKEEATLRLYHIDGRAISSYSLDNGTVTVSGLEKGIYLYRLDGIADKFITGKFSIRD